MERYVVVDSEAKSVRLGYGRIAPLNVQPGRPFVEVAEDHRRAAPIAHEAISSCVRELAHGGFKVN
ncbi:hypothetical protein PC129_g20009 [Phytophthora cactorum]|uniref:Uncharacterized protein n=1 Tax=Phytophthora cactorum TaxID=29920 RepID=A0A8T1K3U1_9STRA|nr:hypothetical protein Pcac1_g12159 [Phytophthora cactorum]KAG2799085.1 hypothetical protein PC111_g20572 [Phytophthora cactorum]KAG2799143.1 hypothetical protein PC112_g21041 [Phytophthora cactorum]KAG2849513.1 hypothetical protein PC113_g17398 [Phytophthora cactorum]KAG2878156.1 hypothetical protein PC114_g23269 [Phytophthora cactorum]